MAASPHPDDFVHYAKTVFKAYNGSVHTCYVFIDCFLPFLRPLSLYTFNNEPNVYCGQIASYPFNASIPDGLNSSTLPYYCAYNLLKSYAGAVKGTANFFAIDCHCQQYISAPPNGLENCLSNMSDPLWLKCNVVQTFDSNPGWNIGAFSSPGTSWLEDTSRFLRGHLKDVQARWPTHKMIASEFGFTQPFESQKTDLACIKEDTDRTNYLMSYLGEMLLSIHEDGIPLKGAFIWGRVSFLLSRSR
ncbi:hypothetical protein D9758_013574 [Tetrapyrgos nigripes]|uniref:Uncharacterized protein n=1 Tax=Tetrapyrgos nigripes TaxID=182062 RepID=A0A8H5CFB2_9AGAR|nr:hypothetical protein D9758_013574 [Tetrapyrgos nigripes]